MKFLKKILKCILWAICIIVFFLILISISIQVPFIQNKIKDFGINFLENKIQTQVSLDRIYINFPNQVEIDGLYLQDQKKDTLLYAKNLKVSIQLLDLLNNHTNITQIEIVNFVGNIDRNINSEFNFDYILSAFVSDEKKDVTTEDEFKLSISKIDIKNFQFNFKDVYAGNHIHLKLNDLSTQLEKIDLKNLYFDIPNIYVDGFNIRIKRDLLQETIDDSVEKIEQNLEDVKPLQIKLNKISLHNFDIAYVDENSRLDAKIIFKDLLTNINDIDLPNLNFDIKNLDFNEANLKIALLKNNFKNKINDKNISPDKIKSNSLKIKLNNFDLNKIGFEFSNFNATKQISGIDFNYLNFSNFEFKGDDLQYTDKEILGDISKLVLNEKSGLNIQDFSTKFYYGPKSAHLVNLYLKTPKSLIQDKLEINYKSTDEFNNNLGNIGLLANLNKSKISFSDILILAPKLIDQDIFKNNSNATLYLDTKITGKINDLSLSRLSVSGFNNTSLVTRGNIKNILEPSKMFFNLKVDNLQSTKIDVLSFLPKNTLPQNINLPNNFKLNGLIKGSLLDVTTKMNLISSFGNASLNGSLNRNIKDKENYNLNAIVSNLQIGKLIKNDSIGKITGSINLKGTSFNPKNMVGNLKAEIQSATYNSYTYNDLKLVADASDGLFSGKLNYLDENADLILQASGSFINKHPELIFDGSIAKLDLYKLKIVSSPMAIKGEIFADFKDLHADHLNGKLRLYNFAYADGKQVIPFDTLKIDAIANDLINELEIKSQIIDAKITGKYSLTTLPKIFQNSISKYYQISSSDTYIKLPDSTYINLNARLKNNRVLSQILPDLKRFETSSLDFAYRSNNDSIALKAYFPNLIYGSNSISNVILNIDTKNEALQYKISVDKLQSDKYEIKNVVLGGDVKENTLGYNFKIKDDSGRDQYKISGNIINFDDLTKISLAPDGLILNYDTWNVSPDNELKFSTKGIYANQFKLENKNSLLSIQSSSNSNNSPIDIAFNNFEIESLTHIIKKDSLLAKGSINGNVQIRDLNTNLKFVGDLIISNLEIMNSKVGNLGIKVTNARREDTYNALITLTGNDNNLKVFGGYNPKSDVLRLKASVQALQMKTLQGFATNLISNPIGYLSGELTIEGGLKQPKILGNLNFNKVGVTVNALNATFQEINETITFTEKGLNFNQFEITDLEKNKLIINGDILTNTYQDFNFNLRLRGNNFQVMNSTNKNNELFYGKLFVDLNMRINGDLNLPTIDGSIDIKNDTDFTFVLPSQDPSIADREGIVEFVDEDNLVLQQTIKLEDEFNQSQIKGLNVNATISINKEATLNIIIDKQNGDKLTVYGEAQLTGGVDPSGKTSLTGTYEIEKGSYEMSFNFIKRKFEIEKGSSIIWTGEPTSATAKITAKYRSNTSPIDLLESQLQNMSQTQRNLYKQRIQVDTYLMMNGELLKPEITFDIKIPEENYNVSSEVSDATEEKLKQIRNDQSEMNKQVIALLVLNRFIGENPFASSAGSSVEGMARQSVSKIISQQLNNLASEIVSGFELNFDLESSEDYSTGELSNRTDLNIELSKRLFDDRLKVSIGSNFGLEGQERANEQMTNIAGDLSAEYSITEDGRYIVRAYRKNRYQVAFQGQVIETGVGFIITMNYNKFKELFQKRRENREFRRTNRNANTQKIDSVPKIESDSTFSINKKVYKEKSKYNLLENKLNANLKFYSFFNKQFFLKPEETTI